jgi:hypothetical protein
MKKALVVLAALFVLAGCDKATHEQTPSSVDQQQVVDDQQQQIDDQQQQIDDAQQAADDAQAAADAAAADDAAAAQSTPDYSSGNNMNCSDFSTQGEAQAYYNAQVGDPDGLDADHDGVACEALPN